MTSPTGRRPKDTRSQGHGHAARASAGAEWRFVLPVFLGAFLLFQIQPIVSKHILPWYGGTPAVWTACLVFFQALLLAGYAYVHLIARLGPRAAVVVHVTLLGASLLTHVLPDRRWWSAAGSLPALHIVLMLGASVGLPYLALTATSPLAQLWHVRLGSRRPPWRLFAASNTGSLLALVSYPFVVEPLLGVSAQARLWKLGFVLFILAFASILWSVWTARPSASAAAEAATASDRGAGPAEATQHRRMWIGWAATGVVLFMGVTNELSTNIAAAPLLWTIPLAIYLLSFVITFSGPRFYPRRLLAGLLVLAVAAFYVLLPGEISAESALVALPTLAKLLVAAVALFVCCLVCHGELYRARPPAARLTGYYVSIALGGLVGGILVGVVAPHVFLLYQELQLGLIALGVLYALTLRVDAASLVPRSRRGLAVTGTAAAVAVLIVASIVMTSGQLSKAVIVKRNFFGLLRVRDVGVDARNSQRHLDLYHGSTLHGVQFPDGPLRRVPTMYYGPISGIGMLLALDTDQGGRHIGIVGMGAGTLATYGRPGDRMRFYEIDPDVIQIAEEVFTYLADSPATWDAVVGDARLSLEAEDPQGFDVLILDAFSSDSIPMHLLTVEALQAYERHMRPGGVLAFHVSNRYVDLTQVIYRLAASAGLDALTVANDREPRGTTAAARWMFLTRGSPLIEPLIAASQHFREQDLVRIFRGDPARYARVSLWTDDFGNLLEVLR